jgi:hypothetical protein
MNADELVALYALRRGGAVPQARASSLAARVLRDANAFGLEKPDDCVQVLDAWLSLAPESPHSAFAEGLTRIVLSTTKWPLATRIAFLRRHLVNPRITPADEADARVLFGVHEGATR